MLTGKAYGTLWMIALCSVNTLAMEEVPSTSTLLQQMESADINEGSDGSLLEVGEDLFLASCSQCHETERATSKLKSYEEWLFTVQRMADKTGAHIQEHEIEPIAEYLASQNVVETKDRQDSDVPTIGEVLAASSVAAHATVSVLWRKGDEQVENEGFFPDVWVGADWQPEDNPFSAQVMACTTCHDDASNGMNVELVEGSFRADLLHLATGKSARERHSDMKVEAKAGRFIVPFGAFSGMAHPGVYRTLTNPLMYNMGRRVGYYEPVLPMPYADEGIDLHLGIPLMSGFQTQLDGYAINGLQEFGFTPSRSYRDNNDDVALGGRVALGSSWITIGGSYAEGELQATDMPVKEYSMMGCDATVRYRDFIRVYYEYARREEDSTPTIESRFSGHVAEAEVKVWGRPKTSLLARYDNIKNPTAYGGATIERFTWGSNIALPGGSLLIINHEHWKHEAPLYNEDIVGVRWVASF